jgi:transketolase
MMGDGELNEGQVWEAAMAVPHFGLGDRIIAIIDRNGIQNDGFADDIMKTNPVEMWRGFGWHVIECDGHDMAAVDQALAEAERHTTSPAAWWATPQRVKASASWRTTWIPREGATEQQIAQALDEIGGGLK